MGAGKATGKDRNYQVFCRDLLLTNPEVFARMMAMELMCLLM
jgi:hypothetical protein